MSTPVTATASAIHTRRESLSRSVTHATPAIQRGVVLRSAVASESGMCVSA